MRESGRHAHLIEQALSHVFQELRRLEALHALRNLVELDLDLCQYHGASAREKSGGISAVTTGNPRHCTQHLFDFQRAAPRVRAYSIQGCTRVKI